MDVVHNGVEEGVERGRGQQFIRWSFVRRLGVNNIHSILTKFRQNIDLRFYIHYSYAYVLTKNETRLRPFYYKQQRGSPWINSFAEAESSSLIVKEIQQLNLGYVKRTKWVLVDFSNIAVKVVLASQPFLGRGPLADQLPNLAPSYKMVVQDILDGNLCLWQCIAIHRGTKPIRRMAAARELTKDILKLSEMPLDTPKTLLDELEQIKQHFNKARLLQEWLGIRVSKHECHNDR